MATPTEKLLLTVPEACALLNLGRTKTYELIGAGALVAVHVGKAIRIPTESLFAYVERLQSDQVD